MANRLYANWVYGGALAGLLLLLLSPLLIGTWPTTLALTFLHLPLYMLHQYEEHDDDRFRRFVNAELGKGREMLTPASIFVINIPGVWGVIALSLYLAANRNIGYALIAAYLVLVNAVGHAGGALAVRKYNPGLITAIMTFLPFGGYTLRQVQLSGGGTLAYHSIWLSLAIAIHATILLYANRPKP